MSTSGKTQKTFRLPKNLRAVQDAQTVQPKGRSLLIFLDGTGDQFDSDNSNIVHLVSCLKKDDPSQVSYYQSGIGTYDGGGLSNGINAAVDMAVGSGLGVHIRDAYQFLMQNYQEGDRVCLFGFSRGAYTARCLAGMIHKVGLLPAHNTAQVPFAYKFYKDDSQAGWDMSTEFKKTFCIDLNVYFIGVFDSVASVGFIPRKLPLSSTPKNRSVYFRHAMGLDERRAKFKPCRYKKRDSTDNSGWVTVAEAHGKTTTTRPQSSQYKSDTSYVPPSESVSYDPSENTQEEKNGEEEKQQAATSKEKVAPDTDVLEVWFTGCHADVGGGAVKNEVRHKLAQIPLRWMIRQCFECNTGIVFHTDRLAEKGLDVHTLWPVYTRLSKPSARPPPGTIDRYEKRRFGTITSRADALRLVQNDDTNDEEYYELNIWVDEAQQSMAAHWLPEQHEDYCDSMAKINDQLVQAKGWWILEVWPIKVRIQPKDSDDWVKKVAMNLGRFRAVPETQPNLHWTVQQRTIDTDYETRARLDKNAKWRVVV